MHILRFMEEQVTDLIEHSEIIILNGNLKSSNWHSLHFEYELWQYSFSNSWDRQNLAQSVYLIKLKSYLAIAVNLTREQLSLRIVNLPVLGGYSYNIHMLGGQTSRLKSTWLCFFNACTLEVGFRPFRLIPATRASAAASVHLEIYEKFDLDNPRGYSLIETRFGKANI